MASNYTPTKLIWSLNLGSISCHLLEQNVGRTTAHGISLIYFGGFHIFALFHMAVQRSFPANTERLKFEMLEIYWELLVVLF